MIPDFQSTMLPLLRQLSKSNTTIPAKELRKDLIEIFKITDQEQKEQIPSGRQPLYYNRIAWGLTHLKMAELISSPSRGQYQLTDSGKKVLENPPGMITIKFLKQFPNYQKNRRPAKTDDISDENNPLMEKTPDELIEIGYQQRREELVYQLLDQIKQCTPDFFEQLVLKLLIKMGYGGSELENGEVTARGADEGIDGVIKEDKLGLDKIYIQAKKWENTVGRPEIQKFVGALQGQRARKGVFITTSNFTKDAIEYAEKVDVTVVLIDGQRLAEYMIQNEIGITLKHNYKIYEIDTDFFIDDYLENN